MTVQSSALDRLAETLKRAKEAAPDGPGLMPQPSMPQDPKPIPRPWQDTDDKEPTE